jgi:hypothetical protein
MSSKGIRRLFQGRRLLLCGLLIGGLQAGTVTPGAPDNDGTVELEVTLPNGQVKNLVVPITKWLVVPGFPDVRVTAAGKAGAIEAVAIDKGVPVTNHNAQLDFGAATVKVVSDNTNEQMTLAMAGNFPSFSTFAFTGPLTGLNTDGGESTFSAEFGVDGVPLTFASMSYSQLSSPDAGSLTAQLFAQLLADLPAGLRPDLSLNQATNTVTFDFPQGAGDFFVETFTDSPGTVQSMAITQAPEPGTTLLLGVGLILISRRWRGKRTP